MSLGLVEGEKKGQLMMAITKAERQEAFTLPPRTPLILCYVSPLFDSSDHVGVEVVRGRAGPGCSRSVGPAPHLSGRAQSHAGMESCPIPPNKEHTAPSVCVR